MFHDPFVVLILEISFELLFTESDCEARPQSSEVATSKVYPSARKYHACGNYLSASYTFAVTNETAIPCPVSLRQADGKFQPLNSDSAEQSAL